MDLGRAPDATGCSQRSAYAAVFATLRKALADALAQGSKRLLGAYLQTLLAYPDGCTRGETVFDPATGQPLVQVPPLAEDRLYPKGQALLDLVAAEPAAAVFAQAPAAAAIAEELLVDDGWQKVVEIEPAFVVAHDNRANGNGPSVELVLSNSHHADGHGAGHAAVPVTTTRPRLRSSHCSPGRSSWPRFQSSPRAAAASRRPRPCRSSSGCWPKSGRRRWSAQDADRSSTGEAITCAAMASPACPYMWAFCVSPRTTWGQPCRNVPVCGPFFAGNYMPNLIATTSAATPLTYKKTAHPELPDAAQPQFLGGLGAKLGV